MASIDLGANTGTGGSSGGGGGGSGTVTQVSTNAPIIGGPITTTGTLSLSSVSLVNGVVGLLPIANVGSSSFSDISGVLPLSRTTGSVSLVNQVVGNLPLSQTSGSLSLINQVVGNLPISQTSGSVSLANQVSGVLTIAFGGTNASAALNGNRFIISSAAGHVESVAVTASAPLRSDAFGLPTVGSTSLSTDVTGILPITSGGFGVSVAANNFASNVGLFCTIGSNNLSVSLKQSDGLTDPSTGTGAASLGIRTISSQGAYSILSRTSSLNITTVGSTTFGLTSSVNQYAWVYVINDAGVFDLGLSAAVFDEGTLCSATSISATSQSNTILYSTASHSASVAVRNIGCLLVQQGIIGTWNRPPDEVAMFRVPKPIVTDWVSYTPVSSWVSNATITGKWRRTGDTMDFQCQALATGTPTGAVLTFTPPGSTLFDFAKILRDTAGDPTWTSCGGGWALDTAVEVYMIQNSIAGSTTIKPYVFRLVGSVSTQLAISHQVPFVVNTNDAITVWGRAPIVGWTTYGP